MEKKNIGEKFERAAAIIRLSEDDKKRLWDIIGPIISKNEWQKLDDFVHHLVDTRADHSLNVCCGSYKIASRCAKNSNNCNPESTAIGAILHDFWLYDWRIRDTETGDRIRIHPAIAYENARIYFPQFVGKDPEVIKDIILNHMPRKATGPILIATDGKQDTPTEPTIISPTDAIFTTAKPTIYSAASGRRISITSISDSIINYSGGCVLTRSPISKEGKIVAWQDKVDTVRTPALYFVDEIKRHL